MEVRNSTKTNIESKLKEWKHLERRRQQLERIIPEQEDRLRVLKDKLSAPGIRSGIAQQTENMDMPRGSDVSDKVGNLVANTLDGIGMLEYRICSWRKELAEIYVHLADIEYEVYQLKETYQQVLTKYYRDGLSQQQVADAIHLSKSWVEKVLHKSLHSFRGLL